MVDSVADIGQKASAVGAYAIKMMAKQANNNFFAGHSSSERLPAIAIIKS